MDADPDAAAAAGIHELNTLNITETFNDMFEKAKAELDEQLPENFDFPEILNAQPVMDLVKALGDDRKAEAEAQRAADEAADERDAKEGAGQANVDVAAAEAGAGEPAEDEGPTAKLYIDGELQDEGTEHPESRPPGAAAGRDRHRPADNDDPDRRRQNRDGLEHRL